MPSPTIKTRATRPQSRPQKPPSDPSILGMRDLYVEDGGAFPYELFVSVGKTCNSQGEKIQSKLVSSSSLFGEARSDHAQAVAIQHVKRPTPPRASSCMLFIFENTGLKPRWTFYTRHASSRALQRKDSGFIPELE